MTADGLARYNGRCTLCGRYVRAGQSRIDTLGFPMPVDPQHASYDPHFGAERGRWVVCGEVFHRRPPASTWHHQDCVAAFLRRHGTDSDRHREIAAERARLLSEMERGTEAQRNGDQWPTRRARRAKPQRPKARAAS